MKNLLESIWRRPFILLPFPPLFWAANLLIGRAYAAQLPPMGLTFWRWVIASIVILPFVYRGLWNQRAEILGNWKLIVGCSVSGFICYPMLNYVGLHTTPAATASILNSTLPLMVPLFAWMITGERPSAGVLGGILLSFVGVGWIITHGELSALQTFSLGVGEIFVLLAVAGYALYSVLLRFRSKRISNGVFLAAMSMVSAAVASPLWVAEEVAGRSFPVAYYSIAALLFIGVFASLVAAAVWNQCVSTLGPTITGASFHLVAIYSSLLAYVLLGEPVHKYHLIGIVLIFLGFAIALRSSRSAAPKKAVSTVTS